MPIPISAEIQFLNERWKVSTNLGRRHRTEALQAL